VSAVLRVLYTFPTFTLEKREHVEYGVVSERSRRDIDVVILSEVPDARRCYPDPETGHTERYCFSEALLVLEVRLSTEKRVPFAASAKEVSRVPAREVAEKVLARASELASGASRDPVVQVGGLPVKVLRFKPLSDRSEVEAMVRDFARVATAARKRTVIASPVLVRVRQGPEDEAGEWLATTLPYVWRVVVDSADAVKAYGVIDPQGFKAPFAVVDHMYPSDISEEAAAEAVDEIRALMSRRPAVFSWERQAQAPDLP